MDEVTRPVLQLGKDVWVRDENNRQYREGQSHPITRGYFIRLQIVGETKQSWILSSHRWGWKGSGNHADEGLKLDKKTLLLRSPGGSFGLWKQVWLSEAAVEDEIFMQDEKGNVSRAVLACRDGACFREIVETLKRYGQWVDKG